VKFNQISKFKLFCFFSKVHPNASFEKKGSRFKTISCSHLASKLKFGEHPFQNLGWPNTHMRVGTVFQSEASNTVKTFDMF
jgi:hypothetical protein